MKKFLKLSIAIIIVSLFATSCAQRTCPTYYFVDLDVNSKNQIVDNIV